MFVYVISCLVNGKRYVGKANMPAQRWTAHKSVARSGKTSPLYRDMRSFGPEAFSFEVVEECESEAASFDAEKRWIGRLDSANSDVGYNLTSGGQGLTGVSNETRRKMSDAKRGKRQTPESVEKRAEANKANGKRAAVLRQVLELQGLGLTDAQVGKRVGRSGARVAQLLIEHAAQKGLH